MHAMIGQLSKLYSPAQPALLKPDTCFQTLLLISFLEIVLKSAHDFLQFCPCLQSRCAFESFRKKNFADKEA